MITFNKYKATLEYGRDPTEEDLKQTIYTNIGLLKLNSGLWYRYAGGGLPNFTDIIRRHYTRSDYTLPDLVGSNDAQILPPLSSFSALSVLTFTDLTGVTITSYTGDQVLSISGNTIVASGDGRVHSLLLSDGTFIPYLHYGYDVSGNSNHANPASINEVFGSDGLDWMLDYGCVKRNPELIINGGFDANLNNWTFTPNEWAWVNGRAYLFPSSEYNPMEQSNIIPANSIVIINVDYDVIQGYLRIQVGNTISRNYIGVGKLTRTYENTTNESLRLNFSRNVPGVITEAYIDNVSVKLATPKIIPNSYNGQPLFPLVEGNTLVNGSTTRLNLSPSKLRLFELGDTEAYKICMDKSNETYWKASIQSLVSYDSDNMGDFLISEMNSTFFYKYAADGFKYQIWAKNKDNFLKDFFIYDAPLTGSDICKAKKYVGVGEDYTTLDPLTYTCSNDNLIE